MRSTGARLFAVLSILLIVGAAPAWATNVSGTISSNTTWNLAGSPYVMTGNVTVNSGIALTVSPGVVVQGNAATRTLTVNGSLQANGSSGSRITFTSTTNSAPGQWTGIVFGTTATASSMKFVDVLYGGGAGVSDGNAMVFANGGTLTVEDSTFLYSAVSGFGIYGGTTGTAASAVIRRSVLQRRLRRKLAPRQRRIRQQRAADR